MYLKNIDGDGYQGFDDSNINEIKEYYFSNRREIHHTYVYFNLDDLWDLKGSNFYRYIEEQCSRIVKHPRSDFEFSTYYIHLDYNLSIQVDINRYETMEEFQYRITRVYTRKKKKQEKRESHVKRTIY